MAKPLDPDEVAFQQRLENAILDVMTNGSISSEDFGRWNLRSYAFANINDHISRACNDDNPHVERLFLLLTIYKCMQRLMAPAREPVKRPLSATEQLYREQQRQQQTTAVSASANKRGKLRDPNLDTPNARYYRAKLARMTPEELVAFKKKEADRHRAWRARKAKLVPGL